MPAWIEQIVVQMLLKLLTPELIAQIEQAAKTFVVSELKAFAASTATDLDDQVVDKIAELLGVATKA